jgi:hypothetical protein
MRKKFHYGIGKRGGISRTREYRLNYSKAYRKAHKRVWTVRDKYLNYQRNARKSNRVFELDIIVFENLVNGKCHYCGTDKKIGIDRKDSTEGYIIENCVPCCWTCNSLKGALNDTDFINACRAVVDFVKMPQSS